LAKEFVVFLNDSEEDFLLPTHRDNILQRKEGASPTTTDISIPQESQLPGKSIIPQQKDGATATTTQNSDPVTCTRIPTIEPATTSRVVKIHIEMEYDEKLQIARNKDINALVPFIEKAVNQKISPRDILKINKQELNGDVCLNNEKQTFRVSNIYALLGKIDTETGRKELEGRGFHRLAFFHVDSTQSESLTSPCLRNFCNKRLSNK
jgi:hypothetical protein